MRLRRDALFVEPMARINPDDAEGIVLQDAVNSSVGTSGHFKLPCLLCPQLLIQAGEALRFRGVSEIDSVRPNGFRLVGPKLSDGQSREVTEAFEECGQVSVSTVLWTESFIV